MPRAGCPAARILTLDNVFPEEFGHHQPSLPNPRPPPQLLTSPNAGPPARTNNKRRHHRASATPTGYVRAGSPSRHGTATKGDPMARAIEAPHPSSRSPGRSPPRLLLLPSISLVDRVITSDSPPSHEQGPRPHPYTYSWASPAFLHRLHPVQVPPPHPGRSRPPWIGASPSLGHPASAIGLVPASAPPPGPLPARRRRSRDCSRHAALFTTGSPSLRARVQRRPGLRSASARSGAPVATSLLELNATLGLTGWEMD